MMAEMTSSTILLVEDEPALMEIVSHILESEGYRVVQANGADSALSALPETRPDLIISDVMMPQMSGFELIRRVQQNERTKGIPFLFLTGRSEIQDRVEGLTKVLMIISVNHLMPGSCMPGLII